MNLVKFLKYSLIGLLVYSVLHAPVSTFLIDSFGYKEIFKSAKDVYIFSLVPVAALAAWQHNILGKLFKDRLVQISIVYLAISLLVSLFADVEPRAFAAGMIMNFRYLAIFFIAYIVAMTDKNIVTYKNFAVKTILYSAMAVVGFGILQIFVLPNDFLVNFGYGPDTIRSFDTVDQNTDFVRTISTLRGANPLGVYLVVITTITFGLLLQNFRRFKYRVNKDYLGSTWRTILLFFGSLAVIYFTYSRAAALGVASSVALIVWLTDIGKYRKWLVNFGLVSIGLIAALVIVFQDSDFVNYTLFHSDQESIVTDSSNSTRLDAYKDGVSDVLSHPLGQGVGSAGPASVYSDNTNFSENYFIQIGQEVGIFGLQALAAIFVLISLSFYEQRDQLIPRALLASFIGVAIAGMFMHSWTDETVAITWWLLAGLYYRNTF